MSIRRNIEDIMQQIGGGNTALGDELKAKSIRAIKGGQGSSDWNDYMSLFSQSPEQLARLLPTDASSTSEVMDEARVSLVANGKCGAVTTGFQLLDGVEDTLDEGLS